ncbi:MAG: non-heme iron oxygenase ferredoxin subunit [Methylococcales bacterium]|jgi:3-phenylpropionate/trans-cinnamate dioxygenase ferredoxin subunit|nr:non-heme iron oxygenase ferredoxin subunit [Methylococcales bacterium]
MSTWISVFSVDDIENGQHRVVDIDDTEVVIFKVDNDFFAIENVCSHDGGEIASGDLENGEIICPRHGARFCIKTGDVKSPPAYEGVESYAVRIENNIVQIQNHLD